jgi:hypothetical protein
LWLNHDLDVMSKLDYPVIFYKVWYMHLIVTIVYNYNVENIH